MRVKKIWSAKKAVIVTHSAVDRHARNQLTQTDSLSTGDRKYLPLRPLSLSLSLRKKDFKFQIVYSKTTKILGV